MDFKKLIADLAARYRQLTEPISSSSLVPPGQVVDVDAALEAGRKAGYEAGYKKGYDEGLQVGLEAKTLPEPRDRNRNRNHHHLRSAFTNDSAVSTASPQ